MSLVSFEQWRNSYVKAIIKTDKFDYYLLKSIKRKFLGIFSFRVLHSILEDNLSRDFHCY